MSDGVYIPYGNELVDATPLVTTQFSMYWVDKVIGVARLLCNPDLYDPNSDRDLAVQQASELVARLMGLGDMLEQAMARLPIFIHPFEVDWLSDVDTTFEGYEAGMIFGSRLRYGGTKDSGKFGTFFVYLGVGDFSMEIHHYSSQYQGAIEVSQLVEVDFPVRTFDFYGSSVNKADVTTRDFTVESSGLYEFELRHKTKNISALGNTKNILGIFIRAR